MALVISDRVKETTTTSGTGTYTLGGAVTGFETFTANLSDGDTTYYACTDNTDFEIGLGTFTTSGTTLARTTILASSNSGSAVNWAAGTRTIFCTLPAAKAVCLDASNVTNISNLKLASGTTVTAILDEDGLSSDSATSLATQQSIKAYVDTQVTAQDLDFQGDTGGALSIDLDSETLDIAGGTGIDTSGAANTLTVAIDSTVATLTGSQTLTNKTLTSPTINSGTVGTAITLNAQADLRFADSDSSNWVAFQAPATIASNVTWTLPFADAAVSGYALVSDASGTLSWAAAGATIISDTSTNTEFLLYFASTTTGALTAVKQDSGLTYNPSTGLLTSAAFSGSGASLTALSGSNISTGTVAAARVATLNQNTTGTAGGLSSAVTVSLTGAVTGSATFTSAGDTASISTTATSDPTITLTGDVTGSGTMTNLGDVSFATTIAANSVALGTDTTGNYVGTITGGTGIASSGATTGEGVAHTLSVDLSELTDMTAAMVGTDEFIVLDASADRRKAANEIGLSIFNNDSGFTTNTGTVTSVSGGTGLSGTVTSSGSLSIDSTVATLTGSQTLTNKTLTAPVISSISNTGTLTLPTSTGTVALTSDIPTAVSELTNDSGYSTTTGTVTSVAGTGTVNGLTLSGTVTTSGSLTLGGTFSATVSEISDLTSTAAELN